jgi:hypothetical protein
LGMNGCARRCGRKSRCELRGNEFGRRNTQNHWGKMWIGQRDRFNVCVHWGWRRNWWRELLL